MEKDVILKSSTRIKYYINNGDKVMVIRNQAYKYKTPFKGLYKLFQMWTNGTVTIRTGEVTSRINFRHETLSQSGFILRYLSTYI